MKTTKKVEAREMNRESMQAQAPKVKTSIKAGYQLTRRFIERQRTVSL